MPGWMRDGPGPGQAMVVRGGAQGAGAAPVARRRRNSADESAYQQAKREARERVPSTRRPGGRGAEVGQPKRPQAGAARGAGAGRGGEPKK